MAGGEQLVLGRYKIERNAEPRGLYTVSGLEIEERTGWDAYRSRPITVKTFKAPSDSTLGSLARAMWDREMRTAHLAGTNRRAAGLLKVVDSRHVPSEHRFVLVTERAADSLADFLRAEMRPRFLEPDRRANLWLEVATLLESLYSLHEVGMIHRNISLHSIFLAADDDGPLFRLGDYSWTVYLHNLSDRHLAGADRVRDPTFQRYRAPELTGPEAPGESFATDLYAMGVALAAFFSREVRDSLVEPTLPACDILEAVLGSSGLNQWERLFFSSLLSTAADGRQDNALRAAESARQVSVYYGKLGQARANIPLTVSFNVRPDLPAGRKNLEALGKFYDINGVGTNAEEILKQDLVGAKVFRNGFQKTQSGQVPRLFIRGRKGMYSAHPYWDRQRERLNHAVAQMRAMDFEPREADGEAFATLAKGVKTTSYPWDDPGGADTWASLFAEASSEGPPKEANDPAEDLRENLWLLWKAERGMLSRQTISLKVIGSHPAPENSDAGPRYDMAALGIPHPEFAGLPPPDVGSWWTAQLKEGTFTAYLVETPSLDDFPSEQDRVTVADVGQDGRISLQLAEDRKLTDEKEYWLLPGGIKAAIVSLGRKKGALFASCSDDYLIQVFSNPADHSVFLEDTPMPETWGQVVNTRPLFVVQGPPGTGKTYTATRVIVEAMKQGMYNRILVVAQAHKPLDHVRESVSKACREADFEVAPTIVRLAERRDTSEGHLATIDEDLANLTKQILTRADRWSRNAAGDDIIDAWREHVKQELDNPGPAWSELVLKSANVVFTTSMSRAIRELADHPPFDLVVVEEAAKAYATDLLGALRLGRNWLLIGDQMQLPPFAFDEMYDLAVHLLEAQSDYQEAAPEEQAKRRSQLSQFIRFFGGLHEQMTTANYPFMPAHASKPAIMLRGQRRLPQVLSDLISSTFYEQPFEKMAEDDPIPILGPEHLTTSALTWIDTPRGKLRYQERRNRFGIFNEGEAETVVNLLASVKLRDSTTVAVLSPYASQVETLQRRLKAAKIPGIGPECVHTVDSFQGREADLVVLSLVRNNTQESARSAVGFLRSVERLNVIMSRAKAQMIVVGNLAMLESIQDDELLALRKVAAFVRENAPVITTRAAGLEAA